jgi:hypothetical protein
LAVLRRRASIARPDHCRAADDAAHEIVLSSDGGAPFTAKTKPPVLRDLKINYLQHMNHAEQMP